MTEMRIFAGWHISISQATSHRVAASTIPHSPFPPHKEPTMPHRSRLAGFIIDCETGEIDEAAEFWSRALGLARVETYDDEGAQYAQLADGPGHLHIEVQKVEHPSRVHLDIES